MFGTYMTYRVPKNKWFVILCGFLFATLTACSTNTILPSGDKATVSPCASFDDCTKLYESITPYKTTVADLDGLGLNPSKTANMTLLNYSDIIDRFNYSAGHKEAFPIGIQECMQAMGSCRGYDLVISSIQEERTGNVVLDLLTFKRKTETKGWIFKTLLIVNNNVIVYKLMGGTTKLDSTDTSTKPLGPLQETIGGLSPF